DLRPMLIDTSVSMDMIRSSMKALEEEISEIDEKRGVPTPSQARRPAERVSGGGHEQARRGLVRRPGGGRGMADRRMIVGELVTVTIQPIVPGHTRFNPDLIEIEPRWG